MPIAFRRLRSATGVLLTVLLAVGLLLTHATPSEAQLPPQSNDIFEASDALHSASRAADDLRHDASNASSAPQLVNKPDFPPSLPKWTALARRSPAQAKLFQPCVDLLLRSIQELRSGFGTMNARVDRATGLIYQGDACLAKANRDGDPQNDKKIQDAALSQNPRRNPDLYGGNSNADPRDDRFEGNGGTGGTGGSKVPRPTLYSSISSTGCPYPPDIDPNNMHGAPPDARRYDAENAFHQRTLLCQQQRGYLVPGGCASVCMTDQGGQLLPVRPRTPAPLPAKQTPVTPREPVCREAPQHNSRFGVGDINQADPPLLVTAKLMEGWDDCLKAKFAASINMLPITFLLDKYRGLKTIASAYGYAASLQTLVADINAIRQPGESLGAASYRVGKLLCDGQDLRAVLAKAVNRDTISHFIPKKVPGKPVPAPQSKPLAPPVPVLANGITPIDDKLLQAFASENKVLLILRNSNTFAARWIGFPGAVPKPMALKAKSLSPPEDASRQSATARAEEAQYAPYYGLASARGLSQAERDAITQSGYLISPKCNGEVITTRQGGYIYSDIDVHGIYDLKGNWAGSNAALKALNGTTVARYFQHGAQDDFGLRNSRGGPSFGPQPPVTAYTPNGPVQLNTMAEMKAFYQQNKIDWNAIYPRPLNEYQSVTGKP